MITAEYKYCHKCKKDKPASEFNKNKKFKDGLFMYCRECVKEISKKYNTPEVRIKYKKNRNSKNCAYFSEYMKVYHEKNKEREKEYRKSNSKKIIEYVKSYNKLKRRKDPLFILKSSLRRRTVFVFKKLGLNKKTKTENLLGASYLEVKKHIESLFTEGMSWSNHGKWEIDHKIPLASAKTKTDIYNLCHYTNLQPLWMQENRSKGYKII